MAEQQDRPAKPDQSPRDIKAVEIYEAAEAVGYAKAQKLMRGEP